MARIRGYHVQRGDLYLLAPDPIVLAPGLTLLSPERAVRRTAPPSALGTTRPIPTIIAFVIALLWLVHPLLTESVTGVIHSERRIARQPVLPADALRLHSRGGARCRQRAERRRRPGPARWGQRAPPQFGSALSVAACLLGDVFSKEIIVSAPLIVFLYDRTFVTGTFRAAWRERRGFYLGLGRHLRLPLACAHAELAASAAERWDSASG